MSSRITHRQEIPKQPPQERIHNFKEVALGYDEERAVAEAKRCLQCPNKPCVRGCPVGIDIPAFIKEIAERDFAAAAEILREKNSLPAVCGRVCPQEEQCEKSCTLAHKSQPIAIGCLERFVADWELNKSPSHQVTRSPVKTRNPLPATRSPLSVAVIGSGPAGLTVAGELAKLGYSVVIFEALHLPGGVLTYGIPEFRLPKEIVKEEIRYLQSLSVEIKTDYVIGKIETIDGLFKRGFKAVYVAIGAGLPKFMGIDGENLIGVYSANEFLTRVNLMKAYLFPRVATPIKIGRRVGVIGGGNVALDSARTAIRLGAEEVYILYRRSAEEMPARAEEFENAREEGIKFRFLTQPIRIIGDRKRNVRAIECIRMKLGEPDTSGRRRPIPIVGSNFVIELNTVIVAIGTGANSLLPGSAPDLEVNEKGYIKVDAEGRTSKKGVFAGGDIVGGSATVIAAMGMAKRAALAIDRYIRSLRSAGAVRSETSGAVRSETSDKESGKKNFI
ncbi:MAG: NADPH-dependent glutamate synthase [Candidatus Omnitrophica bacterium]|nr:NADPH-dependent glutamate synthase [Candidatus Omnitrophota bacterium]